MIKIGFNKNPNTDFILEIRDKNQVIKAQYAIGADNLYKFLLMQEHHINISFNWDSYISFKRSDYIMFEGMKFTLRGDYKPALDNGVYRYDMQFDAPEILFKDVAFYYMNQSLKEGTWKLTSNPARFFQIGVDNINRYFGTTLYQVGIIEPEDVFLMEFDVDTSVFDGFTQVAEKCKAEWYLQGYTLNLVKKFSYGSEVDFEIGTSVQRMDRSEGEDSEVYTRLLALGSTRNIPTNYRETISGESVDAIYQKRLRIPVEMGDVIDAYPNMSPEEVIEGTVIFEEVYPKRIGTMSGVTTVEYTDTNSETGEVTKWNAFRYKDSGLLFKESYVIPGEELRISIQSGDCNGMDFAIKFNPDGYSETDARSQVFEIIRNEDYGVALPNDILHPKNGDTYVLYGFNIDLVSDQYVPEAEQDLYDTAVEWQQERLKDKSVYECPAIPKYFADNEMDLEVGQKVRLVHEMFDGGYRLSRIQGFEKHLINKYQATYIVGDNSSYSWGKEVVDSIKELQIAGKTYQATGGNGVYLIKQFDQTRPTDFNAYSAKASDAKYFNKQTGDTVQGSTTFQQDVKIQGQVIGDMFGNETFTSGQFGSGFRAWIAENGQSYAEFDNILARREFIVNTLTVAEIKSVGGQILLSLADMVASDVTDGGSYWKVSFDSDNGTIPNNFEVDDQVICRKFNGANIKYYWARVTSIGADYINISKTDKDGSGIPTVGDEMIQFGNRTNTARQSAILLSAYGSDAPSIKQYAGINSYDLTGKEVTVISPSGNKFKGDFIIQSTGKNVAASIGEAQTTANNAKDLAQSANAGLLGKVSYSEYNAQMQILSNEISSKVSQTDFNSLGGRVSTAESNITQLSGSITSVVEKVDNIRIGSRNVLPNTNKGVSGWFYQVQNGSNSYSEVEALGVRACKNTCNVASTGYHVLCHRINRSLIKNNTQYTLSVDVYCEFATSAAFHLLAVNGLNSLVYFGSRSIPADTWTHIELTANTNSDINTNQVLYITGFNKLGSVTFANLKLEEGNKATSWSPAPEDVQSGIDEAQNTANSKNRTYYQDDTPVIPSGGHKVGDLWYKDSLVDSSGNINSDPSKNIYQLQYRWDGSTWRQINWSVAKSKIEQTDSSINLLVEKTGINSVGAGSSLFSLINQTASEIRLEVSSIKVGGRNIIPNTNQGQYGWHRTVQNGTHSITEVAALGVRAMKATTSVASTGYNVITKNLNHSLLKNNTQYVISFDVLCDVQMNINFLLVDRNGLNLLTPWYSKLVVKDTWTRVEQIITTNSTSISKQVFYISGVNVPGSITIANLKLEEGNKATSWTPAIEDVKTDIDKAQTAADSAQTNATNANNLLSDISNDNKFTPSEKSETKKEWDAIQSEYTKNVSQASSFSVPSTAYTSAYNALNSYISPLLSNLSTTSDIVGTTFRSRFKAYYDARTDLLNAISTKAKEIADSKTTLNEVKAGITINTDGITAFGNQFKVDANLIANAIETNELSVGDGNFKVGTDGRIKAKGAELSGSLDLLWDRTENQAADVIRVIDQSGGYDQTKILITPKNVRSLHNMQGNSFNVALNSGTSPITGSISGNDTLAWTSDTFILSSGKTYDIEVPIINLSSSVVFPDTGWTGVVAEAEIYLDNVTRGWSQYLGGCLADYYNQSASFAKKLYQTVVDSGTYRLRIVLTVQDSTSITSGTASYSIPAGSKMIVRPIVDAIEIGRNGLMGVLTNSSYFSLTNEGFVIRMGNYGFKVTSGGIQKSSNMHAATPTWTNV